MDHGWHGGEGQQRCCQDFRLDGDLLALSCTSGGRAHAWCRRNDESSAEHSLAQFGGARTTVAAAGEAARAQAAHSVASSMFASEQTSPVQAGSIAGLDLNRLPESALQLPTDVLPSHEASSGPDSELTRHHGQPWWRVFF
jgi:hypothetical protein